MSKPETVDSLGATEIGLDPDRDRVFMVSQVRNRFDIAPNVVKIPFDAVKLMAAQATLADAGMLALTSPGAGVAGNGEGKGTDAGAARPSRVS